MNFTRFFNLFKKKYYVPYCPKCGSDVVGLDSEDKYWCGTCGANIEPIFKKEA